MQSLFSKNSLVSYLSNVIPADLRSRRQSRPVAKGGGGVRTNPFFGHQPDHRVRKTQASNESLSSHPQGDWEGSNT